MRKHRFFVKDSLVIGQKVTPSNDIQHQIKRVLRLRSGDNIYLFNNSGYEYSGVLEDGNILIKSQSEEEKAKLKIHLAQVIGKGTKMNFVIQKATELGVESITPLFSQYSISKETNKLDNWHNVAVASSCQCWRNTVPTVNHPLQMQEWLKQNLSGTKLLFMPGGKKIENIDIESNVNILIGPEGGFHQTEIDAAYAQGFIAGGLGPRILRTETAGIAAIAILQAAAGDM